MTKPTADALLARLAPVVDREPVFLGAESFEVLIALCARLRPRTFRPTALESALRIDARLADGEGDGWRYEAMPADGEAYARGLASVDAEALSRHGARFATLDGDSADGLIRRLQKGETTTAWTIPAARFFEELLVEVATLAYAHPCAQAAIGYAGYADARGWSRVGPNEREEWEG